MMADKKRSVRFDEIDIAIVEALRKSPRAHLREICKKITSAGLSASPETVRKRIGQLNKVVSFQPVPMAGAFDVEEAIILIKVKGAKASRNKIIAKLEAMHGFNIIELVGSFEIMARFIVKNCSNLGGIIDEIKGLPEVDELQQMFVSKSHTSISPLMKHLRKISE